MRKLFRFCLSVLLGLSMVGAVASAASKGKKKAGVPVPKAFFIGNSYTYVNDLPAVVDVMMHSGKRGAKANFAVDSYTRGAASLTEFLDSPRDAECREKLEKGGFRWVILQDQSQTPSEMPEMTMRGGRGWAEIAKKGGAKPVLFITWEHAIHSSDGKFVSTPRMQDKLTTTYCRLALEIHAKVAPVGEAWRMWREKFPETTLYSSDGSHPNALGTYMAGCVFFAVLSGESPVGLPHKLMRDGRVVLEVPAKDAKECQLIARDVVKNFKPETFLKDLETRNAALPALADVRPMLVPGVTVKELEKRLGTPATVYTSGPQTFRHFLLRDGVELQIISGEGGKPEHAMIMPPHAMTELINLK